MDPAEARTIWHLIETVHAVTYFDPRCRDAATDAGFRGFWMGYFGGRAAPLGEVGPGVVGATFFVFHPDRVQRAIPDAWEHVPATHAVEARAAAAAAALRAAVPQVDDLADDLVPPLEAAVDAADVAGRPLFAANREVDPFDDPVADLWQLCTTLREHRGDGHWACLTAEGVGACEALVLFAAGGDVPAEWLRESRGWPEDDWAESVALLTAAGLLDGDGLAERGAALRARVEARTDELAAAPYAVLRPERRAELVDALVPLAGSIVEAGHIPFPNPIGLPQVA